MRDVEGAVPYNKSTQKAVGADDPAARPAPLPLGGGAVAKGD